MMLGGGDGPDGLFCPPTRSVTATKRNTTVSQVKVSVITSLFSRPFTDQLFPMHWKSEKIYGVNLVVFCHKAGMQRKWISPFK